METRNQILFLGLTFKCNVIHLKIKKKMLLKVEFIDNIIQISVRPSVIGRLQNRCCYAPFLANREILDTLYTRGPNFSYTKYGG